MNRPRLLRGAKITWSVVCGLAAVLLLCLWVRSYWWYECLSLADSLVGINFCTGRGKLLYEFWRPTAATTQHWYYISHPVVRGGLYSGKQFFEVLYMHGESPYRIQLGLGSSIIPYRLLVSLTAFVAPLPWLRLRFTLRTLLRAITAAAVVLGLVAYLSR
jgi:hypothetical protein